MVTALVNRTASLVERLPGGPIALKVARRSLRSSLFLNLSSVTGAAIAQKLIGLIILGYVARVLGPDQLWPMGLRILDCCLCNDCAFTGPANLGHARGGSRPRGGW